MMGLKCKARARILCYSYEIVKYRVEERIDNIMKRIYFGLKVAIWLLIFVIVFIIFMQNNKSYVTFNYFFGSATLNTSIMICIVFIIGALFTIGVLFLLNLSKVFTNTSLKSSVKRLEKENAELKRKTHVL